MRIDSPDVNVVPAIPRWLGNLLELQLVDDVADQLAGLLVVEEQRRPVAVQHAGRLRHDAGEQRRQLELRSQIGDQVQEVDLPLALARHPLEPLKRLEADGATPCHASSSVRSLMSKVPSALFSSSTTPIVPPFAFLIGAQTSDVVVYPVCSSTSRWKRGSAYASCTISPTPLWNTASAMPRSSKSRICRDPRPVETYV